MDGFLSEADDRERMPPPGKVAEVGKAAIFQAPKDVGVTLPATVGASRVGEAMQSVTYIDRKAVAEKVQATLRTRAINTIPPRPSPEGAPYPGLPQEGCDPVHAVREPSHRRRRPSRSSKLNGFERIGLSRKPSSSPSAPEPDAKANGMPWA